MKHTYRLSIGMLVVVFFAGCTKYGNNIDLDKEIAKQGILNNSILQKLANAPNGWLLMVPNLDTSVKTATPILLKFDTVKGTFTSKSPFPVSSSTVPSLFELSSATGAPLLSFATGSIFSGWYEAGGITDYFFKILAASADTITLQPYRKGTIYASEGGIIMKMVRPKAPVTWFDNPIDLPAVLTSHTSPFWLEANIPLTLIYQDGYVQPPFNMEFDSQSAGNLAFFQASVPYCRFLQTTPIFLFVNHQYSNNIVYYCGNNTLVTHVDQNFTPAGWFQTGPQSVIKALRTDYLMVRSVNADTTKLDLFAVDVNGREVISGSLEVK